FIRARRMNRFASLLARAQDLLDRLVGEPATQKQSRQALLSSAGIEGSIATRRLLHHPARGGRFVDARAFALLGGEAFAGGSDVVGRDSAPAQVLLDPAPAGGAPAPAPGDERARVLDVVDESDFRQPRERLVDRRRVEALLAQTAGELAARAALAV